jgi:hypothetical protein
MHLALECFKCSYNQLKYCVMFAASAEDKGIARTMGNNLMSGVSMYNTGRAVPRLTVIIGSTKTIVN